MFTTHAILDKYSNIVSGGPDFFHFVGSTNFLPFDKLIHMDDVDKFKHAISSTTASTPQQIVIKIKCCSSDSYFLAYIKLSLNSKLVNNDISYFMELLSVNDAESEINSLKIKNARFLKLLYLTKQSYFQYTPADKQIVFFTIENNKENIISKGNINDMKNLILAKNYIDHDYLKTFESLYRDVLYCHSNFTYDIYNSIESRGKQFTMNKVTGAAVYCDGEIDSIIGTFISDYYSENIVDTHTEEYELDPMTSTLNKTSIIQYARDRLNQHTNEAIVIAILDIDNFKYVNDNFGHAFGDTVIIKVAEIMSSVVGNNGAVGHFGGDEFMVVLDDVADNNDIRTYFRSIRSNIEIEFNNISEKFNITCSIGIASYPFAGTDYDSLFNIADQCLYIAKEYGKNKYVIYDERSSLLINSEENALKNKQNRIDKINEFTFLITEMLFTNGLSSIPDALNKIGNEFGISHIKIFKGADMKMVFSWGNNINSSDTAKYIFDDNYILNFDSRDIYIMKDILKLEAKSPMVFKKLKAQNVSWAMQYLIKENIDIKGFISFEHKDRIRGLRENELNSLLIFSQLIEQLILKMD